ncbi:PDZ domain-containing protein [Virgibacillus sp. NKC19-3]|uniref:PDZ domain-containing protein n=1 Tax=Virgibacillus saliphilus TaxID=2831674 RepID=UPI001C9B75B7|nr:PDZ domain-containing protein [Virgibacillus sp. NKC19-3]MBY7144106.1 PDZ domain-containing protein [Virgibacillus sp. NKC19-3]
MTEAWFIEIAKGIGIFFLNPLVYWSLLLIVLAGYKRIKRERMDFGSKVFDIFSEWNHTWLASIMIGIVISLITLVVGIVFSYETILLLSIMMIVLSLTLRFTMLSASYTIGITYLLLLFLPFLIENQSYVDGNLFSNVNFTGLSILLGLFLIGEAIFLGRIRRNETFPELVMGSRGGWIGQHHVKKLSIIPFFTLVPAGMITPFAPFWPYFSLGGESYSILLVPFIIGFDFTVRGNLPQKIAVKLGKSVLLLGLIITVLAVLSIFVSWLSLVAVLIAILGKEYINYRHRIKDRTGRAYFHQKDKGLKVLGLMPGTPAERLDMYVGETIVKVNGKNISNHDEFYQALQATGASFTLGLLDDAGEIRFVQNVLYEGEHHELGIIFTTEPYRKDAQRTATH